MIRIYLRNWIVLGDSVVRGEATREARSTRDAMQALGYTVSIEPREPSPTGNGYECDTEAEYDAMQLHLCGG